MYDKAKLEGILTDEKYRAVDDTGHPFKPSHEMYDLISEELKNQGSTISKKHVYQILHTNRGGMLDRVLQVFGIAQEISISEKLACSDLQYSSTEKTNVQPSSEELQFKLVISNETWTELKTKAKYEDRKYTVLKKKKWSNIFAQKIYDQTHVECAFNFKRAKVYKSNNAKFHSTFEGKCKECGGILNGYLYLQPGKRNDAVFDCKLKNVPRNFKHKKKRQLRGDLRSQVASEMVDGKKSAVEWRRGQASTIPFGKGVPPTLPNLTVLRKAKQQELEKRLPLHTNNPAENLLAAKCDTLPRTIKSIGLFPFFCHYWSDIQELLYKNACKEDLNSELCIDATSSIATRLILPNGKKTPKVFLYSCVLKSKNITFPAFHMLTTKQDTASIVNFLMEIKKRVKPPRIVVSDSGKAILGAVAHVFAECANLLDYLRCCYQIIMSVGLPVLPTTFIRLDISHFVQMLCRWSCLKKGLSIAREFTIKTLCFVYKCDNFKEVEATLLDLLILLLSKTIGISKKTAKKLHSQQSLEKLDRRIKGEIFVDYKNENKEKRKQKSDPRNSDNDNETDAETKEQNSSNFSKSSEVNEEDSASDSPSDTASDSASDSASDLTSSGNLRPWKTWATELYNIAKEKAAGSDNGTVVNAFNNDKAAKTILEDLLYELPLWTGIMRSFFNRGEVIASSAPVESEFASLKAIFKRQIRVDKFMFLHDKYLDEKVRLAAAQSVNGPTKMTESKKQQKTNVEVIPVTLKKNDDLKLKSNNNNSPSSYMTNLLTEPDSTTDMEVTSFKNISYEVSLSKPSTPPKADSTTAIKVESFENLSHELNLIRTSTPIEMDLSDDSDSQTLEPNSLNQKENWRGQGNEDEIPPRQCGKKRKTKYLSPTPTWDSANRVAPKGIPILLNGNLCDPLYMPKKNVIILDSCAIDSLVQTVANAISMYESYKVISKSITLPIFKIANKILQMGKIDISIYKDRANILLDIAAQDESIFKCSQTRKVHTVVAKCNVANLAEILFENAPSCTALYKCSNCQYSKELKYLTLSINVDVIFLQGIGNLQHAVDDMQNQRKPYTCPKCSSPNELAIQYGPHIIIDTSLLTHDDYIKRLKTNLETLKKSKNRRSSELQCILDSATLKGETNDLKRVKVSNEFSLESIPLTISVKNQIYRIAGVIDFDSER